MLLRLFPACVWSAGALSPETQHTFVATYLLHFALLTTWPGKAFPAATSPLVAGLIGRVSLGNRIEEAFRGEKVSGREAVVRRYRSEDTPSDCQMLFIGELDSLRREALFRSLELKPVLTLGMGEDFCAQGGMVGFFAEPERIRFEIHLERLRAAGLNIHSRLLNLARIYGKTRRP